jgi:hypothetical protein
VEPSDGEEARLRVFELKRFAYSVALIVSLAGCAALPWTALRHLFPLFSGRAFLRLLLTVFAACAAVGLTGLVVMTARCPRCLGAFVTRRTFFPRRCHSCGFDVP